MKLIIYIVLFFTLYVTDLAANEKSFDSYADSLELEILNCKSDTTKIKLYNQLAAILNYENNTKAFNYANKALKLAGKINFERGKMISYFTLANIYQFQGKLDKATKSALKSLSIAEKLNDQLGIGDANNALGLIYQTKKEYDNSLRYFLNAVDALKQTKNKNRMARSLNNAGNSCMYTRQYEKALEYMNHALDIRNETGDKASIADCYNDMGNVYHEMGQMEKALLLYTKCHLLKEEINDREGISFSALNLATLFKKKGNLGEAKKYYTKSILYARELNGVELLMYNYEGLAELNFKEGDFKNAYQNHLQFSIIKDSILNIESNRAMTEMTTKYETEKKEKEILILEKQHLESAKKLAQEEANTEREKNKRIEEEEQSKRFKLIIMLLIILGGVIFYISVQRKKTNQLLTRQNKEITEQKLIIEEKNREILDSIEYARRLQEAILPPKKLVKEYLNDSFILYKPKDIVAGDFYFLEPSEGKVIFAAADCTGHGVPGAMISVVCSNALNRAVKEFKITNPAEILDKVRMLVTETFEKSEKEVKDGMDISLCVLDLENNFLAWSGANNPLFLIRKGATEINEIKADKQPIGNYGEVKPFTLHEFKLFKGDTIYIFTDGFADQFGGDKGKKFKATKMKELFLSLVDLPLDEQQTIINTKFEEWRGQLEQVDDVCIIGIRI